MKGFQIATFNVTLSEKLRLIHECEAMGAKLIRYPIIAPDTWTGAAPEDSYKRWTNEYYASWWRAHIADLLTITRYLRSAGSRIKIIVDCHSPIGGRAVISPAPRQWDRATIDRDHNSPIVFEAFLENETYRNIWQVLWVETAQTFVNNEYIFGYDLANEVHSDSLERWCKVAKGCARHIQIADPDKKVIITSLRGSPEGLHPLAPLVYEKQSNIILTAHLYHPAHLAVYSHVDFIKPIVEQRKEVYVRKIKNRLSNFRAYQKRMKIPDKSIYIGEFGLSAALMADYPKAARNLLRAYTEVLNEYGWHWTLHAWREAPFHPNEECVRILKKALR